MGLKDLLVLAFIIGYPLSILVAWMIIHNLKLKKRRWPKIVVVSWVGVSIMFCLFL